MGENNPRAVSAARQRYPPLAPKNLHNISRAAAMMNIRCCLSDFQVAELTLRAASKRTHSSKWVLLFQRGVFVVDSKAFVAPSIGIKRVKNGKFSFEKRLKRNLHIPALRHCCLNCCLNKQNQSEPIRTNQEPTWEPARMRSLLL